MAIRLGLLLGIFCTALSVLSAEPEWFQTPTQTEYHVDAYWFGVGHSSQLKRAIDEATATLAGQIETTIAQKVSIKDTETQTGSVTQYRRSRQSEIRSVIRQTLGNTQIVKQVKAQDGYYVMVVLNKDQYRSGLYNQLKQLNRDLNTESVYQDMLLSAKHYQKALLKFDSLLEKSTRYDTVISLYNYVSPTPFLPKHAGLTRTSVQAKKTAYLAGFSLALDSDEGVRMPLGRPVDVPVRVRMDWNGAPVADCVIRVVYSDSTVLGEYTTDALGQVEFQPYGLPLSASDQYVTARIQLRGRAQQWQADMPNPIKIPYTVSDLSYTPVAVTFNTDDTEWDKQLKRPIYATFQALGYSVKKSAELSVQVGVEIVEEKTMRSYRKNNYYISGTIVLTADANGEASMTTVSIPFKALAKNRKKAIAKIASDVVMPKIRVLELLALKGDK